MDTKKDNKIWTFVQILLLGLVIYFLAKHTGFITGILLKAGPWAPIVALILYPLLAATPITTDPITVVLGATFGPFLAILISWTGNNLAALVEYFFGMKLGQVADFEKSKQKMPFGLGKLPVTSIPFLVFGRMIPGYGSKIISIVAGAYRVPVKRYIWTTALTNLLGSVMLAYGGYGLIHKIL